MIRKVKGGYRVLSKRSGRNLGTFRTKAAAHKREAEVEWFWQHPFHEHRKQKG